MTNPWLPVSSCASRTGSYRKPATGSKAFPSNGSTNSRSRAYLSAPSPTPPRTPASAAMLSNSATRDLWQCTRIPRRTIVAGQFTLK